MRGKTSSDAVIAQLALRQHGVVARWQLLAAQVSPRRSSAGGPPGACTLFTAASTWLVTRWRRPIPRRSRRSSPAASIPPPQPEPQPPSTAAEAPPPPATEPPLQFSATEAPPRSGGFCHTQPRLRLASPCHQSEGSPDPGSRSTAPPSCVKTSAAATVSRLRARHARSSISRRRSTPRGSSGLSPRRPTSAWPSRQSCAASSGATPGGQAGPRSEPLSSYPAARGVLDRRPSSGCCACCAMPELGAMRSTPGSTATRLTCSGATSAWWWRSTVTRRMAGASPLSVTG
jgi:hypothetical protein